MTDYSNMGTEELQSLMSSMKREANQLHNRQMMIKILMNSLYGAVANKYFSYFIEDVAEAITMSGQLSIRMVAKRIDEYLNKISGTKDIQYVGYCVAGDTKIMVNETQMTIEDFFNQINGDNPTDDRRVLDTSKLSYYTPSYNVAKGQIEDKLVRAIIRSTTKKKMIELQFGDEILRVTSDHRFIVSREGSIQEVKAEELCQQDKFMTCDLGVFETKNFILTDLGEQECVVYDIEVEDNHNFFANGILVHSCDTDSAYVNLGPLIQTVFGTVDIDKNKGEQFIDKVCEEKIQPVITKCYSDLAETMGVFENAMSMKREKINRKGLLIASKRYILSTLNSEGVHYDEPKISVTGVESVRSSTPEICRTKMKKLFQQIMDGSEDQVQEFIEEFRQEFYKLPANSVAKNSGTDDISKYEDKQTLYKKGCPIHIRGVILYNNALKEKKLLDKYSPITSGDKVKFVYLKTPNPIRENVIAFPETLPKELGLDEYIDYETQFDKVFLKPMVNILDVLNWSAEKVDTLESFFG